MGRRRWRHHRVRHSRTISTYSPLHNPSAVDLQRAPNHRRRIRKLQRPLPVSFTCPHLSSTTKTQYNSETPPSPPHPRHGTSSYRRRFRFQIQIKTTSFRLGSYPPVTIGVLLIRLKRSLAYVSTHELRTGLTRRLRPSGITDSGRDSPSQRCINVTRTEHSAQTSSDAGSSCGPVNQDIKPTSQPNQQITQLSSNTPKA
ncbi:hypothetical protein Bca52824_076586 [Brassica carinata]|uniref:Uncharacterized protein n=1 Tax=Brassica carinata TaxID=52824 RepID=A0A8X7PV52_BRACI|nr:hypothetical protein Bca52824_076586 [Brassica carinata]